MPRRQPRSAPSSADVAFTHVEKVFYPKVRFTKGDIIQYYLDVAPILLPHLHGRPVTLKRFPNGIRGAFFYEKDAPGYTPEWVPTFPVPRHGGGEPIRYILIEDARVLAWCANLGTIELHPFLHRVPAIEVPTAVAFDLDPGEGVGMPACARVALRLRETLDGLGLQALPKVSGSKGLQVYVPLNTPARYEETRTFAQTLAELLHRENPAAVVSEMAKALRRGKVFIDWSQNSDFKTTVGVYSLRAKHEEPYVSVPVTWDEVAAAAQASGDALQFSPADALARVHERGDLFAPVLTLQQRLPAKFSAAVAAKSNRRPRALRGYDAKRNFGITPEPQGAPRRSAQGSRRRFVVQKHAASHLHYDFRLEMDETLKSWAVPKGLPYALNERRSAFATEDHPLEYLMFEGIIPAGQYGGGTVMVWDAGTYDVVEGNFWKGFLRVYLKGKKLKGEWTLTRVEVKDDKARWVVEKTGQALRPISARRDDRSAVSGRSMSEIAAAPDAVWESDRAVERDNGSEAAVRAARKRLPEPTPLHARPEAAAHDANPKRGSRTRSVRDGAVAPEPRGAGKPPAKRRGVAARGARGATTSGGGKRTRRASASPRPPRAGRTAPSAETAAYPEPGFITPMLAQGVAELPAGDAWLYEVKWDGYRVLAAKHGDTVRLYSRRGNDLAADFPGVVAAVRALPITSALLDGEVVALDAQGRPQFQMLQHRASARGRIVYYAYDLLQREGEDLRARPLIERKAALATLLTNAAVRLSADLPGAPEVILERARALGLEGIVAKRRGSAYRSGERNSDWVKLKLSPEQEFVVGGYKPGTPLESLLVGYYDGGRLLFAGKVRQGLNPRNRVALWQALREHETGTCPFANLPNSKKSHFGEGVTPEQMKELRWAQPRLVAQVAFTEWTEGGNLRHATFLGLRDDKVPRDVRRELAPPSRT